jgi:HD-GYP domain-containing protein (c-di-GMP phosphodiesterase class II)
LASRRIVLQGMQHPIEGLRWEADTILRIGRQENQDIVLNHPSISKQHAEVYVGRQGWVVRDIGSTTGTFVNGVRVGQKEWKLHQQDVLQCGALSMTVANIEEETPPPAVPSRMPADIKTSGDFSVRIQATSQRSWEKALESLGGETEKRLQHGKHFLTLLRAGYHFCNVASIDEMLQSILDDTVAVLNAQRGSIVLRDARSGQLEARAISAKPHLKKGKSFSKTLAQRCFNQGESMLCRDVKTDADLQAARSVQQGTMASIICALFRSPRQRLGVLHLDRGPMQPPFTQDDFYVADAIAASVSVGIETAQLIEKQRDEFYQSLASLAQSVEMRAPYLAGHAQRVASYSVMLAEELQLTPMECHHIRIGAVLHDVGKLTLDDALLNKAEMLTGQELETARSHTTRGANLLSPNPALAPLIPIVRNHHERWDGQGYPDRLPGVSIPRLARIVSVANFFDSVTSNRPYRPALPVDKAFSEIQSRSGTQFDPDCVQAFIRIRPKVEIAASQVAGATSDTVHIR